MRRRIRRAPPSEPPTMDPVRIRVVFVEEMEGGLVGVVVGVGVEWDVKWDAEEDVEEEEVFGPGELVVFVTGDGAGRDEDADADADCEDENDDVVSSLGTMNKSVNAKKPDSRKTKGKNPRAVRNKKFHLCK